MVPVFGTYVVDLNKAVVVTLSDNILSYWVTQKLSLVQVSVETTA